MAVEAINSDNAGLNERQRDLAILREIPDVVDRMERTRELLLKDPDGRSDYLNVARDTGYEFSCYQC